MKAEDLYEAMQYIRPAFLEESEMKVPNKRKKWPRRLLLIAAAAAVGIVGAAAVRWSLRSAARADANLREPIPEWTEYQVPGETASEEAREEPQPEMERVEHEWEPENGWISGITLDSTLCSGEHLTAYLRVPDISPEIAAELAKPRGEYYFDIGSCRIEPPGEASSFGITYVSYDEAEQTVLLRVDITVKNATEIQYAPSLCRGLDKVGYYDLVTIPITPSSCLHTEVSMDLPRDETWGDMRIAAARVYASYVEVELKVTPFGEVADKERYPDVDNYVAEDAINNPWRHAKMEYLMHLDHCTNAAMADAAFLFRDGSRQFITDPSSEFKGNWSQVADLNALSSEEEFCARDRVIFRHETPQAIDLSQVEAITIGGVDYPLQ